MKFTKRLWYFWIFLGTTGMHHTGIAQETIKQEFDLSNLYWLCDDWVHPEHNSRYAFEVLGDSIIRGLPHSGSFQKNHLLIDTLYIAKNGVSVGGGIKNGGLSYAYTFDNESDTTCVYKFENLEFTISKRGFDLLTLKWDSASDSSVLLVRKPRIQRFEMPGDTSSIVMRKFWHLTYISGSNRSQSKEEELLIQSGHMAHLGMLAKFGKACVAGPTDGIGEVRGFVIFSTATLEEAVFLARLDPAVRAGRLSFRIDPWWAREGTELK